MTTHCNLHHIPVLCVNSYQSAGNLRCASVFILDYSIYVHSPRQTWLGTIENDLKQQSLGLWSAWHRAYDREHSRVKLWRHAT